jgi:hypothetical protein
VVATSKPSCSGRFWPSGIETEIILFVGPAEIIDEEDDDDGLYGARLNHKGTKVTMDLEEMIL